MKQACRLFTLVVIFIALKHSASGQTFNDVLQKTDSLRSLKQVSLKTESLAEILQASINNGILSAKGTDINIKATIFQLKKLWRPDIVIDTNYAKETFSRNFEFGIGVKINTDNKINGIGSSIKYAIINHRDVSLLDRKSLSKKSQELREKILPAIEALTNKLHTEIAQKISDPFFQKNIVPEQLKKITDALQKFTDNQDKPSAIKNLENDLSPFISMIGIDRSIFDVYAPARKAIDQMAADLENEIKKGSLLTFGFSSNYIEKKWDSLTLKLEYIKGLGWNQDEDKPWDIYAGAFYDLKLDTFRNRSLNRHVFYAKLGLNKVLLKNRNGSSFLEILGAAEYNNIVRGSYPNEKSSVFMADFTLTLRLSKSLFLPFEIKYDPENANVFGFLKVKWDLPRTSAKE